MRICIIGSGPTGLGAANRLMELGFADFKVFERDSFVGGLSASYYDARGFTWDFGVHVTHSHYRYFDNLLDEVLPGGYFHLERRSWIRENGSYVPYPFQYNIRYLPRREMWECIQGLLDLQERGRLAIPEDFEQWVVTRFGDGIARHFMLPYNRKLWRTDLGEMTHRWTGDRVPPTDIRRVLENVILMKDDVSWGCNSTFRFPKKGGTGAIWQAIARRLPDSRLFLNHRLVRVDSHGKALHFANGRSEPYDVLISTIPVTELVKMCGLDVLAEQAKGLRHTAVTVLGVGLPHPLSPEMSAKTWVYCPAQELPFYRLTPFSAFSPAHVPASNHCGSLLCEISMAPQRPVGPGELQQATLDGLRRGGWLNGNGETVHTYAMNCQYGYPTPTKNRDQILADILPALEQLGIYSRGRFGGWKYEVGNMDHSVMQGVEAAERILNDTPERTLWHPDEVNSRMN